MQTSAQDQKFPDRLAQPGRRIAALSTSTTQHPGLMNWLTLALLGLIWGASFMSISVALNGAGPLSIAAIRLIIAAVTLIAVATAVGLRLPAFCERKLWLCILGMGLFTNAIPFTLLSLAIQNVPSAFAGLTMAAVPLLVLPLAHFLVPGERMSRIKSAGFALGFIGVLVLIGVTDLFSGDGAGWSRLACIGAAFCYAIGSIITRVSPPVHPLAYSAGGLLVGSLIMAPIALSFEGLPGTMSPSVWGALIYLGLGPTALATILLVRVIQSAGPSFMSLVNYQVPVWSVIFGVAFLDETLPGNFVIALVLILGGLAISQASQRRLGRYPSA